jgi:hypothetical protein
MSQSYIRFSKVKVKNKLFLMLKIEGFANMLYYGVEGDYNVMVMDILGPTLFKMFEYCDYKYSLKTMCMIAL